MEYDSAWRARFDAELLAAADKPSSRKDDMSVLAGAVWYGFVRASTGFKSSYALERLFEPQAFGLTEDGDPRHSNNWPMYSFGRHQPSTKLQAVVEQRVPGATRLLKHPIWDILRNSDNLRKHRGIWIAQLAPDIQRILVDSYSGLSHKRKTPISPVSRQLKKLENRLGIDALAGMSILLLDAVADGRSGESIQICLLIYRCLLAMSLFEPFDIFGSYLFNAFRCGLSSVEHNGLRYAFETIDFEEMRRFVRLEVSKLQDYGTVGVTDKETAAACMKVLRGDFRLLYLFALMPPFALADKFDGDPEVKRQCEQSINTHKVAIFMLCNSNIGYELGMDLSKRKFDLLADAGSKAYDFLFAARPSY